MRRREIDGLRAFAVGFVVVYHYWPGVLENGFLGVDIFFVISGYVITGLIHELKVSSKPSLLSQFYARRAIRLLPALVSCVLLFSMLFAFLTSQPDQVVFSTASAAIVGLSNIYLFWKSADYFALHTQLNPFTHTWSLGVEEQFYLLYPMALCGLWWLVNKCRIKQVWVVLPLCLFLTASYIGYLHFLGEQPIAVFYLPLFRFWEILLGCVVYFLGQCKVLRFSVWYSAFALALIGVLIVWDIAPNWSALSLVCVCIAFLLYFYSQPANADLFRSVLSSTVCVYIGRISYGVYLYHWPWLAFATLTVGASATASIGTLALTMGCAIASFHFLEMPMRRYCSELAAPRVLVYSALPALTTALVLFFLLPRYAQPENSLLARMFGVKQRDEWPELLCHGTEKKNIHNDLKICLGDAQSTSRDIFLLGDSHAAQLWFPLNSLIADRGNNLKFINTQRPSDFPFSMWLKANSENDRILSHVYSIAGAGDTVVIAFYKGHFNPKFERHVALADLELHNGLTENFKNNMVTWIEKFQGAGVDVVFVLDTPLMAYVTAVETCALQQKIWNRNSCTIDRTQDLHTGRKQEVVFKYLQQRFPQAVKLLDAPAVLYGEDSEFNPINVNGSFRMTDWNHLTVSEALRLRETLGKVIFGQDRLDDPPDPKALSQGAVNPSFSE